MQIMAGDIFKGDGLLSLILFSYEAECAETVLENFMMRTHNAKLFLLIFFAVESYGKVSKK
jgi:hypothetical protein